MKRLLIWIARLLCDHRMTWLAGRQTFGCVKCGAMMRVGDYLR